MLKSWQKFCKITYSKKRDFFFDDIDIKSFKFNYKNELVLLKIQRYIMKHVQWIDEMLIDLKRIKCIIFDEKSQFCMKRLKIVKYMCDVNERYFDYAKIDKIMNWKKCQNAIKIWIFIDICVYYRIFIEKFVQIVELIYRLMKKRVNFNWNQKQCEFMNRFKFVLISSFAFIIIDYFEETEQITLIVDASLIDWETMLMQIKNNKKHSIRYENDIWSFVKRVYDVIKRECRDVFKTFEKRQFWLYEIHFILKTNAKILIVQFNRFEIDLSNVFITK